MNKKIPQRRCVGCFQSYDKNSLCKVVRLPDGTVVYDKNGNLDGRGAYVCKNRKCFEKVKKTNALGRALKCEIPEAVYELLEGQVETDG